MEKILFLTHTESDNSLGKTALETLNAAKGAARKWDAEFSVGLIGEDVQQAADSIAGCGAAGFYGVSGSQFAVSRYGSDAAAMEALCRESGATIVLAPSTSRMSRVLPGVAQRLGGKADTHLTELGVADGKPAVSRWYYRQRMVAEFTREQRPWFLTLDPGCFAPWEGESGSADLTAVDVDLPDSCTKTEVLRVDAPAEDQQTIRPEADILFVAGAGWTKKQADGQVHIQDAEREIRGFLEKSKASLGSSKSLVDLSGEGQEVLTFMSHLHQVGQTGSTPRHPKGLATCCHGEEPHVVGWRFIKERRAVNLDPNCGWAQGKADVLYVADAFAVMKKVNELLQE